MSFDRNSDLRDREGLLSRTPSNSAPFVIPLALLIVSALLGWLFFGHLSPTVDNTGTTTLITQPDLPQ